MIDELQHLLPSAAAVLPPELRAATADRPAERKPPKGNGVTVIIPLYGVLSPEGGWDWMSGRWGTSTKKAAVAIQTAAQDPVVARIILDVDSPGGTVRGTTVLVDAVRAAAKSKDVIAVTEGLCCSAAYHVASQARRIVAERSAVVGSIGTMMILMDSSKLFERIGLRPVVIASSPHKSTGVPGLPISEVQEAQLRQLVLAMQEHFSTDVGNGRALRGDALANVADGRVFTADQAKKLGLVDEIGTLGTVLAEHDPARMTGADAYREYGRLVAAFGGDPKKPTAATTAGQRVAKEFPALTARASAYIKNHAGRGL